MPRFFGKQVFLAIFDIHINLFWVIRCKKIFGRNRSYINRIRTFFVSALPFYCFPREWIRSWNERYTKHISSTMKIVCSHSNRYFDRRFLIVTICQDCLTTCPWPDKNALAGSARVTRQVYKQTVPFECRWQPKCAKDLTSWPFYSYNFRSKYVNIS